MEKTIEASPGRTEIIWWQSIEWEQGAWILRRKKVQQINPEFQEEQEQEQIEQIHSILIEEQPMWGHQPELSKPVSRSIIAT